MDSAVLQPEEHIQKDSRVRSSTFYLELAMKAFGINTEFVFIKLAHE